MPVTVDLLDRKLTHFVLWRPNANLIAPRLVIGQFVAGNPNTLGNRNFFSLLPVAGMTGLWSIEANACGLVEGTVYHYWFETEDTKPPGPIATRILVADPAATTIDWRLLAPPLPAPYGDDDRQPASVIKFRGGKLIASDPRGEEPSFDHEPSPDTLPTNRQMVIYEMPTAWSRMGVMNRDVGTFQDVTALIDKAAAGGNFAGSAVTAIGKAYLLDLGINALELLPAADSFDKRAWGYGTSHYHAPDSELGFPDGNSAPTPNRDLTDLVNACHHHGIRFIIDVVMAFGKHEPYRNLAFNEFCIEFLKENPPNDIDAYTSTRGFGRKEVREGSGSTLWRYSKFVNAYDPVSGAGAASIAPAQRHMLTYLAHWMRAFHVDGVRIDSVENVANWDFLSDFKSLARDEWNARWAAAGLPAGAKAQERFIVVGEELSLPMDLISTGKVEALWNEQFQAMIRAALLGVNADDEPSFEWTVRKAIDCRILGFADGTKAVNYVTKHDVEGRRHERLYNMFKGAGLGDDDVAKRVKMAFACMLTSVGIPMFLAGEEFADQHDLFDAAGHVNQEGGKQVDPVNYDRATEPMRAGVLETVSRLVKLRTSHPALAVDDVDFIHVDFNDAKRVLAWRRGGPGQDPVVVVANFSDFGTVNAFSPGRNMSSRTGRPPRLDADGAKSLARGQYSPGKSGGSRSSRGRRRST